MILTKGQLTAIICCACLGFGLAFVRLVQHTEQQNDQSQNTVVNTITKTVVINTSHKKYKNIKWHQKLTGDYKATFVFFNNELNEWQKETAKVFMYDIGYYAIYFRTVNEKPIVYTNGTVFTNRSKSLNTNSFEVKTIWSKVKGIFGK